MYLLSSINTQRDSPGGLTSSTLSFGKRIFHISFHCSMGVLPCGDFRLVNFPRASVVIPSSGSRFLKMHLSEDEL